MTVREQIIWIDVESTGLNVFRDVMLEIAAVATDMHGNIIGDSFSALVAHNNVSDLIDLADDNVVSMHEKSGLWKDLWDSKNILSLPEISESMLSWLDSVVLDSNNTVLYFGGNSPKLDRDFVRMCLPEVSYRFSHRNIDITSISLAVSRNCDVPYVRRKNRHRALDDVKDSIHEFKTFINQLHEWNDK